MDLKSCSKCGRIHPRGQECKSRRVYRTVEERKLRSSYSWKMKARQIREDAQNLCEVCRQQGIYTYEDLEVHHITKIKDDPNMLLDDDNLICLCVYHHKQADNGEIEADYLRKIARERGRI